MSSSALDRRELLALGAGSAAALALRPLWARAAAAAPAGERALVVLELNGGNDGLNTLAPLGDELYRRLRPRLALARGDLLGLDRDIGLHPALARTRTWFERGSAAAIQQVGYPGPNLSHFHSLDVWHSAQVTGARPACGWLGRWRDAQAGEEPLAMLAVGPGVLPYALRGRRVFAPSVAYLAAEPAPSDDRAQAQAYEAVLAAFETPAGTDDPELRHVRSHAALARESRRRLASAAGRRRGADYPTTRLGHDLALVADVLAAGLPLRVAHVVQPGYDTHVRQLQTHARLLAELDLAVDAFLTDLRSLGRLERTLVLCTSEFGRRAAENGIGADAGTDHGAASALLAFGGSLRPGLHGVPPDLERLDADGNLPHAVDFRQVYATVLERWLGTDAESLLGARFEPVDLLPPS
ncbi:MAG TPA: DUF1501 domain-containing protein [Planctomycetota bacterium]|nr:DUF1501 domain-containing protein [Planctomycetota bacterium]